MPTVQIVQHHKRNTSRLELPEGMRSNVASSSPLPERSFALPSPNLIFRNHNHPGIGVLRNSREFLGEERFEISYCLLQTLSKRDARFPL